MLVKRNAPFNVEFFLPDENDPWSGVPNVPTNQITVEYLRPNDSSFNLLMSPSIQGIGLGWYRLGVPSSLTVDNGNLILRFTAPGAKSQQLMIQIVSFDPNDANGLGLQRLDASVSSRSAPGDAMTLTTGERSNIASAVWGYVIEGSHTALKFMQWMGAVLFGKRNVSGTGRTYFGMDDNTVRVDGTVDSNGNRVISSRS